VVRVWTPPFGVVQTPEVRLHSRQCRIPLAIVRPSYSGAESMEIVLLWLDELDDLAFSGLPVWRGLRRLCLTLAFAAAASLHVLPAFGRGDGLLLPLHDAALIALALWTVFAAISASAERSLAVRTAGA
jgi:hypothetical protein